MDEWLEQHIEIEIRRADQINRIEEACQVLRIGFIRMQFAIAKAIMIMTSVNVPKQFNKGAMITGGTAYTMKPNTSVDNILHNRRVIKRLLSKEPPTTYHHNDLDFGQKNVQSR